MKRNIKNKTNILIAFLVIAAVFFIYKYGQTFDLSSFTLIGYATTPNPTTTTSDGVTFNFNFFPQLAGTELNTPNSTYLVRISTVQTTPGPSPSSFNPALDVMRKFDGTGTLNLGIALSTDVNRNIISTFAVPLVVRGCQIQPDNSIFCDSLSGNFTCPSNYCGGGYRAITLYDANNPNNPTGSVSVTILRQGVQCVSGTEQCNGQLYSLCMNGQWSLPSPTNYKCGYSANQGNVNNTQNNTSGGSTQQNLSNANQIYLALGIIIGTGIFLFLIRKRVIKVFRK